MPTNPTDKIKRVLKQIKKSTRTTPTARTNNSQPASKPAPVSVTGDNFDPFDFEDAPAPVTVTKTPQFKKDAPLITKITDAMVRNAVAGEKPPLYHTMTVIGLMLATVRSHDSFTTSLIDQHVPLMKNELAAFKIKLDMEPINDFLRYSFLHRWTQAYAAVKDFYNAFGLDLKKAIANNSKISAEMKSLADTFLQMIAARDPARWGKLETTALNKLKYLGNPIINQVWRVSVTADSQSEKSDDLKEIVRQVRGDIVDDEDIPARDRLTLSVEQKNTLRKDNPELLQQYNKTYNTMIKAYRAAARNYVLDKGGDPQPIAKARAFLEQRGFFLHELPEHLDRLFIGEDGFYYTKEGNKIMQRPQPGTIFLGFNSQYDPTMGSTGNNWLFQYRTEEGEPAYAYAELFRRTSKDKKSDKIETNLDEVFNLRPRWVRDLKSSNQNKWVLGLITDILFHFAARIGGVGNFTRDVGNTYGISTLLVKHVKIKNNNIHLDYLGKSGQHQVHIINATDPHEKLYIPLIKSLIEGKSSKERLFTFEDGKPVGPEYVRKYFNEIGIPVNPHSFRSVRGTALAKAEVEQNEKSIKKMDQAQAEKWFKTMAEKVGKLLGHFRAGGTQSTSATAISAGYIAGSYMVDFFNSRNLRVPLWAKIGAKDME